MEELERRLHDLLHDDHWTLDPPPDTLERVHRGVQRRHRRRRAAAGGLSALAVVAIVTTALTVPPVQQRLTSGPASNETSATPTPERSTSSRPGKAKPSEPIQERRTTPPSASAPERRGGRGGPVPHHFKAASLTAVSTDTFWVLGTAPCDNPVCTSVVQTTDGGQTFRGMPAPKAELAHGSPSKHTVHDLRFADTTDGYAYGGGLWTTHDGASTWARQPMPGTVVRLAATAGTAWALVSKGGSFELYSSPTSRDDWSRVSLPVSLTGPKPGLAVDGNSVTVVGSSNGKPVTLLRKGGGFKALDRPCDAALPARLSPTSDSLWMFCATGTQGTPYVSTDHGRSWSRVDAAPARGGVGPAAGGHIYGVSTTGAVHQRQTPSVSAGTTFAFIGFTTPRMGYAVLDRPTTGSLWRTVDGGRSWRVVSYPDS